MGITFHANGDVTGTHAGRFGASGTVLQTVQGGYLCLDIVPRQTGDTSRWWHNRRRGPRHWPPRKSPVSATA